MNLGKHLQPGFHGQRWTEEEIALLGTLPDTDLAKLLGKNVEGVRQKRNKLGIPSAVDRRRRL